MFYLSDEFKATIVQAGLADGQTDPDSTAVDMAGFDGVVFIGVIGTITGTGTVTLAAAQSSDNSTFNALSGGSDAASGSADSDKLLMVDVYKPADRYVRTTLTRATANSVYGGTIALQYRARSKPTTHTAASLAGTPVQVTTPAES